MKPKLLAISVFAVLAMTPSAAHATLVYEWTGVVPTGAIDTLPLVSIGERWTLTATIDNTVADTDPGATRGIYFNAASAATLAFSGGFSTSLPAGHIYVFSDYSWGADVIDGVQGYFADSTLSHSLTVQTATTNLAALADDTLPVAGVSFGAWPNPSQYPYYNLTYAGPDGYVQYSGTLANNTAFSASAAVPEPTTLLLLSGGLAGLVLRRRRS